MDAAAKAAWHQALTEALPDDVAETVDDIIAPGPNISFVSLEELHALTPEDPDWIWEGYIAAGTAALIAGKPKVGKTSLVFGLVRAMCNGATEFLGHTIVKDCPLVYVSEEGGATLRDKLPPHGNMSVLTRERAYPQPEWHELIVAAVDEAIAIGARLIVIDTLRKWAKFGAELEKDASAMQRVVSALDAATREGIAVLLVHHQRKAEGEHGDAIAGSNALPGAVDVVLEVQRTAAGGRQRVLLAESRWKTPAALVFEKHDDDDDYDLVAEGDSRREAVGDALVDRVVEFIETNGPSKTTEIRSEIGGKSEAVTVALAHAVQARRLALSKVGSANIYSVPDADADEPAI